jgi:hypothetical protein
MQSFAGPSAVGLVAIFYCLRFETSFPSLPTTRRATVEVFEPASTSNLVLCLLDSRAGIASLNGSAFHICGKRALKSRCHGYATKSTACVA